MKITEVLTKEEIQKLLTPSDLQGARAVATTWILILGSLAVAAWQPNVLSIALALVVLGGRHLALAILMHDAAHYSLFRTRWLNDFVGSWLCAYPTWQHLPRYREHHMRHHKFAGSDKDPDIDLVRPFPVSKASLRRKLLRDLSGISGLKRIYGLLLMDLGLIEYTVAGTVKRIDQKGRSISDVVKAGAKNLHGVFVTNALLAGAAWATGHFWLYGLWVISYLTTFSVFVRVRSIAEHACTEDSPDARRNTRTTAANLVARLTVAPHYVNYHLEHHLLMTVPNFSLPVMHSMLAQRGYLKNAFVAPGYMQVLREASACK